MTSQPQTQALSLLLSPCQSRVSKGSAQCYCHAGILAGETATFWNFSVTMGKKTAMQPHDGGNTPTQRPPGHGAPFHGPSQPCGRASFLEVSSDPSRVCRRGTGSCVSVQLWGLQVWPCEARRVLSQPLRSQADAVPPTPGRPHSCPPQPYAAVEGRPHNCNRPSAGKGRGAPSSPVQSWLLTASQSKPREHCAYSGFSLLDFSVQQGPCLQKQLLRHNNMTSDFLHSFYV